ncbi:hypothetical protein F4553_000716 [Allocatelliglobosispora scoriae]|uniref:Uncharacterized protein n=2 Tax=Allocatelliglobosispora scoriae TaxID=643052 RepID=A0A841BE11_9ACTN|nr:hypothetical protein [Allocatelliglobosispora scoriae]
MHVCDLYADGKSAVVIAWLNDVRAPDKWHTSGARDCTERSYGNLIEGTHIDFMACLGKYSTNTVYWDTCGYMLSSTA